MKEILSIMDFHPMKIIKKFTDLSNDNTCFVKLIIYLLKPNVLDKIKLFGELNNKNNYHVFLIDVREHRFDKNSTYLSSIFELKDNEECNICQDRKNEESKIETKIESDIKNICISCEIDLIFEEFLYLMVNNNIDPIDKLQKDGYNISITDEKEYGTEYGTDY